MRFLPLLLIALMALSFVGCKKDAEVNAFLTEWETTTNDMVAKIDAGDIDGAQKAFDAKKDSLKKGWEGIKTARGFQVSKEIQDKAMESAKKNTSALTTTIMKNSMKLAGKPADAAKLQSLLKDYSSIFQ